MKTKILFIAGLCLYLSNANAEISGCSFDGIPLQGKVKVVNSFADIKVQVVNSFADIKVKKS